MGEEKIDYKAVDFVQNLIKTLNKRIEIRLDKQAISTYIYRFHLKFKDKEFVIELGRRRMDDFESAIENYPETDYYYILENALKFKIYVELGSNGLLTDFEISSEIMNEKEHRWKENPLGYEVKLSPWMYEVLYRGLKTLSEFLNTLLTQFELDRQDIRAHKDNIDNLISYYDKHGTLSESGVVIKRLGLMKAAAVCEIIRKEKERSQAIIPIVKSEINKEIYKIVCVIRNEPFRCIKIPEFIRDYYVASKNTDLPRTKNKKADNIDNLLDKLDPNFKKKRIGAWAAFRSTNPDRLSQSANSMVELLDKVIGLLCRDMNLREHLAEKYGSKEAKWIEAQLILIRETKDKLHRIKHHDDYKNETLAENLLSSAEAIMRTLLTGGHLRKILGSVYLFMIFP